MTEWLYSSFFLAHTVEGLPAALQLKYLPVSSEDSASKSKSGAARRFLLSLAPLSADGKRLWPYSKWVDIPSYTEETVEPVRQGCPNIFARKMPVRCS